MGGGNLYLQGVKKAASRGEVTCEQVKPTGKGEKPDRGGGEDQPASGKTYSRIGKRM